MRQGITWPAQAFAVVAATASLAVLVSGCGSGGGSPGSRQRRRIRTPKVSGTLRVFAYEDSVVPELIDPVLKENPDLTIETATFDSNEEAAAKLAGGFEADVVEICLDEMTPLVKQDLMRPIDPKGITEWDNLDFTDAEGIVLDGRPTPSRYRPASRASSTTARRCPEGIDEIADVFDPQFAGRSTIHGNYALLPIAEGALAMGIEDPFTMDAEQLEQTKELPDRHQAAVPRAVERRLGPRQPLQVGRGRRRDRRADARAAAARGRSAGRVVAGQGGDAVVGLRLRAHLQLRRTSTRPTRS